MDRITIDELNKMLESADHVKVTFNKGINHKTRAGSYVTIRKGMLVGVFFVGRDLQWEQDIVERVGP